MTNYGPIASMELPPSWKETPARAGDIPRRMLRSFAPPDTDEIELSLFYRGRKVSKKAALKFKSILQQPSHPLEGQEMREISDVLLNMGDNQHEDREMAGRPPACIVKLAETGIVNHKNVLVVQGTFQKPDGEPLNECIDVFIDAQGNGETVFEVFLVVPSRFGVGEFQEKVTQFRAAVATIKWANQLEMSQIFSFEL